MYIVHCGRSGFEASHEFEELDAATRFYNSEVEQIGPPVGLIELDDEGNLVRLIAWVSHGRTYDDENSNCSGPSMGKD